MAAHCLSTARGLGGRRVFILRIINTREIVEGFFTDSQLTMSLRRIFRKLRKGGLSKLKRLLYEEILVLGDSHACIFRHKRIRHSFPRFFFNVTNVGGATASGLAKPNSRTKAYQIFRDALKTTKAKTVIVILGEVDTGFVIWYRAKKYDEAVSVVTQAAIKTYTGFLSEIKARSFRVICVSTPLPTIKDGNDWGEIANARKEISATQAERTALTLAFNQQIEAFCQLEGISFINLDKHSLGENGTVNPSLLNSNPNNHHYEPQAYAALLVGPLKDVVDLKSGSRS